MPILHFCFPQLRRCVALQLLPTASYCPLTTLMQPDDELCLCFHVTQRKVANYLRIEKPRRVAQLSECYGAGTGCGWCRPFLERMFTASQASATGGGDAEVGNAVSADLPDAADYARERGKYVREGGGTPPPGAAPPTP